MSAPRPIPVAPTRRLALLATVPFGLAVLALVEPTLLWPMLAADGLLLLLAAGDLSLGWRLAVEVRRQTPDVLSLNRDHPVGLTLRSRSKRPVTVDLTDELFPAARAQGLPITVALAPRQEDQASYQLRSLKRGRWALGGHHLRWSTPLGLWSRQSRIQAEDEVRVFPDIRAVHALQLMARQDRMPGMRSSRRRGGENEFDALREYRRGDEFRSVDWRATARKGRLISRDYKVEENQNLMFVLDGGRLMTTEVGGLSLYDHALNATLMLAHVAARNGDNVGLVSFAERMDAFVAPVRGPRAPHTLVNAVYRVYPRLVDADVVTAMETVSRRVRKRTLMLVFTQVVDDISAQALLKSLRAVQPRHLPVCVLFRDEEIEAIAAGDPAVVDPYTRAAAAEMLAWRDHLLSQLQAAGALVVDVPTQGLAQSLIARYLEVKARHLL
jgi:uncharacterized protein (DUF58 family)